MQRHRGSIKHCYNWRVGATSFVVPADMMFNVRLLADMVDNVQLLFFESHENSSLEHPVDIPGLSQVAREHDLTYTVHLPSDLHLGATDFNQRQHAIDQIVRLVTELDCLAPKCYDLHLLQENGLSDSKWLDNLDASLNKLSCKMGSAGRLIGIENLDYQFDPVASLASRHGFSVSLDIGHALRFQHGWEYLMKYVLNAAHIHYHGVVEGKDHLALPAAQDRITKQLGMKLEKVDFNGVVTLEVYSLDFLKESIGVIERVWALSSGLNRDKF
ncbi:MAG: cobamide remodeling phosphodiesterase CbiR [Thermodesulfobacteriota bacterium]|nr:cobamide remodeling phosphodiesterase CbiR [Thermodesulfobacteriota bacterium]